MTVKHVIETFENAFSDLKVIAIYKIDDNKCMIIASSKKISLNPAGSPNAFLFKKDSSIIPINPMENLDSFIKITSSENQVYDATKEA